MRVTSLSICRQGQVLAWSLLALALWLPFASAQSDHPNAQRLSQTQLSSSQSQVPDQGTQEPPESEHTLAPKFGGLATGQGPGIGVEYRWDYRGRRLLQFRSSAQASPYGATRGELEFTFQTGLERGFFFNAYSTQRRYPRVDYYGPGPNSRKTGRTVFLYEDFAADAVAGLKPWRGLQAGLSGG
ncbi:MAG: hypothetical protein H5T84_01840, partial [Thermoleophilia bacterium]|nr:hypothetical protein [Thermoleophilia bacterium]